MCAILTTTRFSKLVTYVDRSACVTKTPDNAHIGPEAEPKQPHRKLLAQTIQTSVILVCKNMCAQNNQHICKRKAAYIVEN